MDHDPGQDAPRERAGREDDRFVRATVSTVGHVSDPGAGPTSSAGTGADDTK